MVPHNFWCEAVRIAVHLINRFPTKILNNIAPFESLFGHPPSYFHLLVLVHFASFIFLSLKEQNCSLNLQSGFFLGYDDENKGFICYDPDARHTYILKMLPFSSTYHSMLSHLLLKSPMSHFFLLFEIHHLQQHLSRSMYAVLNLLPLLPLPLILLHC